MSDLNVDSLLKPVSADNPIGDTAEYSPDAADLERTAQGKPERQAGANILPAEPPDWSVVERKAVEVLGHRKDLRVAVLLAQAALERHGMEGFCQGLAVIRGLLETYWDGVHPRLDPEDGNDPAIRVNVLAGLTDGGLLRAIRSAPLIRSRAFGSINLRQIAVAAGQAAPTADTPAIDSATVSAAAQDAPPGSVAAMAKTLQEARAHLAAICAVFETRSPGQGPELTPLTQLVDQAYKGVSAHIPAPEVVDPAAGAGAAPEESGAKAHPSAPKAIGEITCREDVLKAIERICAYYVRQEPASPVPLFLERCKRLVTMNFLDIVRDMAPDAVSQVEMITGSKQEK